MTKDIVNLINRKLKEMEENLIFLKEGSYSITKDNLKEDIIRYWGIERGIQILIELVIDISNIIISANNVEKPNTYRQTIMKLSKIGVIPKDFAIDLSKMVGYRNILVHDYAKIDEEIILDILNSKLDDFANYIDNVKKWLKENYS